MSGDNSPKSFARLTLFGWILLVLAIPVAIGAFASFQPFTWLNSREPSVWRFGLEVVLLMIQVPLVYAAWKNVRRKSSTYRWDRAALAIWAFMSLVYVLESRFALQKGDAWRPHVPMLLLWTLIFAVHAWGRKPERPPANDSTLNNQTGIARDASGVI